MAAGTAHFKNIGKSPAKFRYVGHITPYTSMTPSEKKAFRHSYSRHHKELGLPNWQETKSVILQSKFNDLVSEIRQAGANSFFKTNELVGSKVGGKMTPVLRTEPTINGQKYYYYETLDGKFISAGRMP
jgi:hypothetical protein